MPAWMHARAEHLMAKNPSMPKSEAFAIATQQMEALGKDPKGFGTSEGHQAAKKKYKTPEDDVKTAMDVVTISAMADEFAKIALACKEKDSGAFMSSTATRSLPATATAVQHIPQRLPRQNSFTPAVVGTSSAAPKAKPAPPSGALNPGGGFS